MDLNPYQSPIGLLEPSSSGSTNDGRKNMDSVAAWERLRLLYNGILAGVVLLTTLLEPAQFFLPDFWASAICGGIGANLCFCLGVTLEYYLALIGVHRRWARIFLFIAGTLFSMLLTFVLTLLSINAFQIQD